GEKGNGGSRLAKHHPWRLRQTGSGNHKLFEEELRSVSRTLLFDWEPLDTLDGMVSEESATLEVELNPDGGFYLYGLSIQHIGSISPLLDSLNGSISEDRVPSHDVDIAHMPFGVDGCLQEHVTLNPFLLGFFGVFRGYIVRLEPSRDSQRSSELRWFCGAVLCPCQHSHCQQCEKSQKSFYGHSHICSVKPPVVSTTSIRVAAFW